MSESDHPVLYQEALSRALADITASMREQDLDPLRYLVDVDAGLPLFAPRDSHRLRIAYNHHAELSMEASVPHEWLIATSGADRERYISAIAELVSVLKNKIEASGRPL